MPGAAIAPRPTITPLLVRGFSVRAAATLVFFGALWFVLCRHLSGEWSVNDQYSYGWFVPFFALLLFWFRWEQRPTALPEVGVQRSVVSGQWSATRNNNGALVAALIGIAALLLLLPVRVF